MANPPDYTRLSSEFAWEKTSSEEKERRRQAEPVVQSVSSQLKQLKKTLHPQRNHLWTIIRSLALVRRLKGPLRVLDVGCAAGKRMMTLHERAADDGTAIIPYGIEISTQLAKHASHNFEALGGRAVEDSAMEGVEKLPPNSIDVAVMHSFLEHECRPLELLTRLRSILIEKGVIVLKVPNFNCLNRYIRRSRWCGFRYPDYTNYFTPRTLSILAKDAGYGVLRQHWIDKLPLSDNMYAVLENTDVDRCGAKRAA